MIYRPYQQELDNQIIAAWNAGHRDVLAVLPCGGGKTAILSNIIDRFTGGSVAIAHRRELVGQMSRTIARYGVKHRIVGPKNVVRDVVQSHIIEFGKDYYDPQSKCAVASVDTLVSWAKPESPMYSSFIRWAAQVGLRITDEAHHLVKDNKWGRCMELFPNALGLGVTATPERADGKGLGRHADGFFDVMVEGPSMRELINGLPDHQGGTTKYLTDYRIFCPPSNLDLSDVGKGTDGDYIRGQLALKTKQSTIMGDVVTHYLRLAPGKLGVTFAPDVETATIFSKLFNEAGVPAEVVTAKTPDKMRVEIMKRFRQRRLLQLINVDLFGEGFDLPAIEVLSMARATDSYGLYVQQFGRPLRLMEGKEWAIIIDHVGNVLRHGLPDRPRVWTLDRRERKSSKDKDPNDIPMKICRRPECMAPYEAIWPQCPFCGWEPVPAARNAPELVDGDLYELDAATLAAMRGEVLRVDRHPDEILRALQAAGKSYPVAKGAANQHEARQRAQIELREAISWYGGVQAAMGRSDRVAQRAFYHQFGIDVLTAQTLGRPEAEELTQRVNKLIGRVV